MTDLREIGRVEYEGVKWYVNCNVKLRSPSVVRSDHKYTSVCEAELYSLLLLGLYPMTEGVGSRLT